MNNTDFDISNILSDAVVHTIKVGMKARKDYNEAMAHITGNLRQQEKKYWAKAAGCDIKYMAGSSTIIDRDKTKPEEVAARDLYRDLAHIFELAANAAQYNGSPVVVWEQLEKDITLFMGKVRAQDVTEVFKEAIK